MAGWWKRQAMAFWKREIAIWWKPKEAAYWEKAGIDTRKLQGAFNRLFYPLATVMQIAGCVMLAAMIGAVVWQAVHNPADAPSREEFWLFVPFICGMFLLLIAGAVSTSRLAKANLLRSQNKEAEAAHQFQRAKKSLRFWACGILLAVSPLVVVIVRTLW